MRYLYKIWSGYDGFTPRQIPARKETNGRLELGWKLYLDDVEPNDEVWVYFHGPHAFEDGVYLKGKIDEISANDRSVFLVITEESAVQPITAGVTSKRVADTVSQKNRQVFLYPQAWGDNEKCTALSTGSTCAEKRCELCDIWMGLPIIRQEEQKRPSRLTQEVIEFVTGYWVIPRRCFLYYENQRIRAEVIRSTELFYTFKLGHEELAYPLALGVYEALRNRGLTAVEAVVPIPLSPDKAELGELHRTRALAKQLSLLMGVPVRKMLSLAYPISKGRMIQAGWGTVDFEENYREAMCVDASAAAVTSILLVDDVVTRGSTLSVAAEAIKDRSPDVKITAALAGQMILKESVSDASRFLCDENG